MGGNKGFGAVPKGQKFKPGTIKRLMSYLKEYKVRLTVVVICILISAGASVAATLFLQTLIDDYIGPLLLEAPPNFGGLLQAILGISVVFLAGILASLFYARTMAVIAQSTLKNIRDEMFTKMQTLPIRYFDTRTHGDIMSYYTNDADTLRQMISQSLPNLFSSVVSMIAVLISMIHLSIWLTLIVLVVSAVILMVIKAIAGRSGNFFMKQLRSIADVNGYIEEMVNGQKVVKVFCYEEKAKERFKEKNENLGNTTAMANTLANILMPVVAQLGNVSYVICAMVGGILAINGIGSFTLGGLASFLTFNKSFNMPINQVSQQFNSIVMALAGAKRIFDLLDEKPEVDEGYVTLVNAKEENGVLTESDKRTGRWAWKHFHKAEGTTDYIELKGDMVLEDVDFGYNSNKIVLHDINMYAQPGQKIAFVGSTGAGKTTITNLLNRFYDIQKGKIRYDGINITKIKKDDLRRSMGIVLQDTNLFTATVMENIRYGKLDATDEEVIAAAKLANADGFIRRLPQGYNTLLRGNGANLSQGQRQLLSIARAAVADPPVLIQDEATSSNDTRTEKLVQEGMDKLMEGRTTLVIAHRLSTVRNSDCIMVLEQGHIIERGSHEELLTQKGRYYQLYNG